MDLSEYIEVVSPTEIKIRGHRIWMEHILSEYLGNSLNVEELERRFDTLNRPQILAALLYYHANQAAMDHYRVEHRRAEDAVRAAALADPKTQELREKIKRLAAERRAKAGS